MPYDAPAYLALLQRLLPRGRLWPRDSSAAQTRALATLVPSWGRLAARDLNLLTDAFPVQPVELLPEWEATLGLPDPCAGEEPTLADRQSQVLARFADAGGAQAAYYTAFAATLGYTITITTCRPYQAGDPVGQPLYDARWLGVWCVTVTDGRTDLATLQCELLTRAPAHTVIVFNDLRQTLDFGADAEPMVQ